MTSYGDEIDSKPKAEADEEEEKLTNQDWSYYFHPTQATKLITGRFCVYFIYVLFYYLIQLAACIGVVNFYGDADRFIACNGGTLSDPEEAAKVFDVALLLLAIYHLVEWIKTTILFTVVIVGINLMWIYYVLCINSLFGIIAIIYTMIARFSVDGTECAAKQVYRGEWLIVEIIGFWVLFFLYPGPIVPLRLCKKESHDDIINKDSDDSDGSDED